MGVVAKCIRFVTFYMDPKQNKKRKQTLEVAHYGLQSGSAPLKQWALSILPQILKILGGGANGTDISRMSFQNFGCTSRGWPKIPENRNNLRIEFNMVDSQASKHNSSPLSGKRLKYLTTTLLQWISFTSFSK